MTSEPAPATSEPSDPDTDPTGTDPTGDPTDPDAPAEQTVEPETNQMHLEAGEVCWSTSQESPNVKVAATGSIESFLTWEATNSRA